MKYAKITETDADYIRNFSSLLVQIGCKPIAGEPLLFEIEDSCDLSAYHGVEVSDKKPIDFAERYAKELAWIRAYTGTFDFYVSLKTQLERKGSLSPKQMESLTRAVAREGERAQFVADKLAKGFDLKPGQVIVVGKFIAERIGAQLGHRRAHHVFEIINVHRETERAYQLTVKMSVERTRWCCICGLTLTNKISVAAGIGPICAEKYGIGFGESSLEELAPKLSSVEGTIWVAKRSIKNWTELTGKPKPGDEQESMSEEISPLKKGVDYIDAYGDES